MQDYSSPIIPPVTRSRGTTVFIAFLAFLLGGALVVWAASQGYLSRILRAPNAEETAPTVLAEPVDDASTPDGDATASATPTPEQMAAIGTVEGRVALLEDRLSRVDAQTYAASGNAARAEGLLIAFAARRMIDRGDQLGFVADQLRLRFMNAQPRAVETVIAFSRNPVTIDELAARLEALSPDLTETDANLSLWERARREFTSLFAVHKDSSALVSPSARIDRAKLMLTARRMDNAISEVQRLPGADAADKWIADAHRYQDVQRALDLLETTAMLEPTRLQDAQGHKVDQPSPLATPTATEDMAEIPSPPEP